MPSERKKKPARRCAEVTEDREALLDYEEMAQTTALGKYRCRDCGKLFETLEEHDKHHRKVHRHTEIQSSPGMTL